MASDPLRTCQQHPTQKKIPSIGRGFWVSGRLDSGALRGYRQYIRFRAGVVGDSDANRSRRPRCCRQSKRLHRLSGYTCQGRTDRQPGRTGCDVERRSRRRRPTEKDVERRGLACRYRLWREHNRDDGRRNDRYACSRLAGPNRCLDGWASS